MQAGILDRFITIEKFTATQDSFGQEIETWTKHANVWAKKQDIRGDEFFNAKQFESEITTRWKIRWRSDLNTEMRITYSNTTYNIRGIIELGRNEGLELMTEANV